MCGAAVIFQHVMTHATAFTSLQAHGATPPRSSISACDLMFASSSVTDAFTARAKPCMHSTSHLLLLLLLLLLVDVLVITSGAS
jgi:hypothetical protein